MDESVQIAVVNGVVTVATAFLTMLCTIAAIIVSRYMSSKEHQSSEKKLDHLHECIERKQDKGPGEA
jgi:hypothetical protein